MVGIVHRLQQPRMNPAGGHGGDSPALVDEVHHQGAEDEEDQQRDEHVVDGADVVHLKQLTAGEFMGNTS